MVEFRVVGCHYLLEIISAIAEKIVAEWVAQCIVEMQFFGTKAADLDGRGRLIPVQ